MASFYVASAVVLLSILIKPFRDAFNSMQLIGLTVLIRILIKTPRPFNVTLLTIPLDLLRSSTWQDKVFFIKHLGTGCSKRLLRVEWFIYNRSNPKGRSSFRSVDGFYFFKWPILISLVPLFSDSSNDQQQNTLSCVVLLY